MIVWFRYVPHSQIGEYLARGWTIDDDLSPSNHAYYAVLMKWVGEGEPEAA